MTIPDQAITAAYQRVADRLSEHHHGQASGRQIIADALEAAAPHLAAAERQRIRQLAIAESLRIFGGIAPAEDDFDEARAAARALRDFAVLLEPQPAGTDTEGQP